MNKVRLTLPISDEKDLLSIKKGDEVIISGKLFVARDAAHKRIFDSHNSLALDFDGSGIYYMGPSEKKEGDVIGSAGPTTSQRMDKYTPYMLSLGARVLIGKGPRSSDVINALKEHKSVYLQAFGGCGALYSSVIKSASVIAYDDLLSEALLSIEVEDMVTICIIDSNGEVF